MTVAMTTNIPNLGPYTTVMKNCSHSTMICKESGVAYRKFSSWHILGLLLNLAFVAGAKREAGEGKGKGEGERKGRGKGKGEGGGKREGSPCYKSPCFCIPPTNQLSIRGQHGPNFITLFTGNCEVETLFSNEIIIVQNKTFQVLFLLSKYDRQWSVTCEYRTKLWSCLIKGNGRKVQKSHQPETRIIYERRIIYTFVRKLNGFC